MKTKIYKTAMLALCFFAAAIVSQAQLPNFTKIDTGAITITPGGHVSSACFDMDNDGDLDLLISNVGVYISRDFSVYKNERNGFYVEIPKFVYLDDTRNLQSIGDIDNDGDIDLFAGIYGTFGSSRLYLNDGYGNYKFNKSISLGNSSIYPSLIDFNGDSFLDIVLIDRYGRVFLNDGEGGFQGYGLGLLHEPSDISLHGMSWGDCDDDGDFDFYGGYSYNGSEGGHVSKNTCFLNNGDGTFVKFDETSVIVDDSTSENMCVNWVDYDNDGDMDLYVLNFTLDTIDGPLNALYENLGDMQFAKHVFEDEMYRNSFKISSVWGDLDNDADLDLYVTVENNVLPWPGGYTSATPFNLLFVNDGNGGFTNILDHSLAYEDSHTALMFDHDNDGDLDVLLTRYSWSNDGHTNLLVNEGNDNSWIVLSCEGTTSNRSAIGTRVQAKSFVYGKHITQTREITPVNGHLSYANLRVHFGLGNTDVIDTLIIRWPSGLVDTYLNVHANQFYRAIEDEGLGIDFKATNYIEYSPAIPLTDFTLMGDTVTIELSQHYRIITGDTVPENMTELAYEVIVDDTNMISATLSGSLLTLIQKNGNDYTDFHLIADADFTKRMDHFVAIVNDINTHSDVNGLRIYPNPFATSTTIEYELTKPSTVQLTIYDYLGKQLEVIEKKQAQGKQQIIWNAEGLPAGVYYFRLLVGEQVASGKVVLIP